jgi:hypothetical protein
MAYAAVLAGHFLLPHSLWPITDDYHSTNYAH